MTDRSPEIEKRIQAYADASEDTALIVAFGTPGSKIMHQSESEDTGQQWVTPGFMRGIATGIGEVVGAWKNDNFDLVLSSAVTLTATPISADTLMVFLEGTLLREVTGTPLAGQYKWDSGSKMVDLHSATGWLSVYYAVSKL